MKHEDTHKYWGKITKKECSALRGIAIMAICLHNYCHILPHSVQYTFPRFFYSVLLILGTSWSVCFRLFERLWLIYKI